MLRCRDEALCMQEARETAIRYFTLCFVASFIAVVFQVIEFIDLSVLRSR